MLLLASFIVTIATIFSSISAVSSRNIGDQWHDLHLARSAVYSIRIFWSQNVIRRPEQSFPSIFPGFLIKLAKYVNFGTFMLSSHRIKSGVKNMCSYFKKINLNFEWCSFSRSLCFTMSVYYLFIPDLLQNIHYRLKLSSLLKKVWLWKTYICLRFWRTYCSKVWLRGRRFSFIFCDFLLFRFYFIEFVKITALANQNLENIIYSHSMLLVDMSIVSFSCFLNTFTYNLILMVVPSGSD